MNHQIAPFIPKEHSELPDQYGVRIYFLTGGFEDVEVVKHRIYPETQLLEYLTKEDEYELVPTASIKKMKFDKRFSKICQLREENAKKANAQK
jgi:hypothetical protein